MEENKIPSGISIEKLNNLIDKGSNFLKKSV